MNITIDLVEGATNKERLRLEDDAAAIDATGLDAPTLELYDRHGAEVVTAGAVAWVSAAGGTLSVDLEVLALTAALSPYRGRFWLTDLASNLAAYPDGGTPMTWRVHPVTGD